MGIWSMSASLLDGLLLGYYVENYVWVETLTGWGLGAGY
jgi:hypothetical protein